MSTLNFETNSFSPTPFPIEGIEGQASSPRLPHPMPPGGPSLAEGKSLSGKVSRAMPSQQELDSIEGAPTKPASSFSRYAAMILQVIVSFIKSCLAFLQPLFIRILLERRERIGVSSTKLETSDRIQRAPIPIRLQWNGNGGYCGEVCMIGAGLRSGQYCSQYDARAMADGEDPTPSPQTDCQLFLGQNDQWTAQKMKLDAVEWDNNKRDTKVFLAWVKERVREGHDVSIGLYTNEYLFYGKINPNAGDKQYDHIVSVLKIDSRDPTGGYLDDDVLYFCDNGLWNPEGPPQYVFSASFKEIQRNRKQANDPNGAIYTLADSPKVGNFGIAITGVIDPNRETLPVSVETNVNYESPEIVDKSNKRPGSMPLTLKVSLSELVPGVKYKLYKYNKFDSVPTTEFNAHASNAEEMWEIEITDGSTYTLTEHIQSSDQAIYRAVRADAP